MMGSHGSSEASYEASFKPMNMASLADMTQILLTLASAKRNSEVWAFRAVVHFRQAVVSAKNVWPKNDGPE